jgi:hypothetical protein
LCGPCTRPCLPTALAAEHGSHLAQMLGELDQRLSGGEPVPTRWAPPVTVAGSYPVCPLPSCKGLVPVTLPLCFAHWWQAPADVRAAYNLAMRENRKDDADAIGRAAIAAVADLPTGGERNRRRR